MPKPSQAIFTFRIPQNKTEWAVTFAIVSSIASAWWWTYNRHEQSIAKVGDKVELIAVHDAVQITQLESLGKSVERIENMLFRTFGAKAASNRTETPIPTEMDRQ